MKSLICALNTKYIHSSLAPWYLKASVENLCPDEKCDILETTINESEEKILEQILQYNPDLLAFSTYIWNVNTVISLSQKIKSMKNVKILLGGPEVSYNAKEVLEKNPCVDFVISGEGEYPFADLCSGKPVETIKGLCYRENEKIILKEPFLMENDPPVPYSKEYFETLNGRIAYIETSRGCPYRCAFCLSGRCAGVRFFDIEQSKKNIVALANSGAKTVKFVDRTFNADKKRARELFNFIIDGCGVLFPDSVCFHFEIEGDILDDETLGILSRAKAGLIQMEIGLQSFNKQTLDAINRKTNLERLCDNVRKLLLPQNIHIHIDLIVGLPYESIQSFEKSFSRALKLKPHMLQLGFLKMLHGAELRERKEAYQCEYDATPPYEIKSTLWLSNDELKRLHDLEDVFDRLYNSGRFPRTAEYIHEKSESAFKFYTGLAEFVKNNEKKHTLDDFSYLVYRYLCENEKMDESTVRDLMATDRLSTNKMGVLPEFLKIHSPKLKEILNLLEKDSKTKKQNGIKRAITPLKSEDAFAYVDYDEQNPVTKQYKIKKYII